MLQMRIGKVLCLFSLVMFISRIIPSFFIPVLELSLINFRMVVYSILFFISFVYINKLTKVLQILVIFSESIISLNSNPNSCFFGYIYGFLNRNKRIKLFLFFTIIYTIFILIPLKVDSNKYIISLKWCIFIFTFLCCLYYLFSDYINTIKNIEYLERQKLIDLILESNKIAKDAINLSEKYFNKYIKE